MIRITVFLCILSVSQTTNITLRDGAIAQLETNGE